MMKRFQLFATVAALFIMLPFCMTAQVPQGQGRPGRGFEMTGEEIRERAERMAGLLELTEDQKNRIIDVDMQFYNKLQIERQKMRNAGGPPPDRQEMRERMMKMRDERNTEYEKILTPEQYKKFIEIQEQRRSEMRSRYEESGRPGAEGGDDRPQRGRGRN